MLSVDRFISARAAVLPCFQRRLFATPLGSLSLGFPFGWPFLRFALGFLFSLTLGLTLCFLFSFALGLAFGLLLGLTLGLALRFLLRLALGSFLFRLTLGLTFACFFLRSATFGDLSLRLLTRYLTLLRNLSLRSFFTRLLLGSHIYLRVGYPALSIYNKTEKSSKSSDAVNIFEIVFFG